MRAIHIILIASTALGGAALAQGAGNSAGAKTQKTDVAPIQFDLAKPPSRQGSLPVAAATLEELTYANETQPAAPKAAAKPAPKAAKAAPKSAPKPAHKAVAAKQAKGPWMSEWRRAYIAKHGRQPPVAARWP